MGKGLEIHFLRRGEAAASNVVVEATEGRLMAQILRVGSNSKP